MEVVESIENGNLSQIQVTKYYGVHNKTIHGWISKYANFVSTRQSVQKLFFYEFSIQWICEFFRV
jgi:transposase